jgi:NTE family protein
MFGRRKKVGIALSGGGARGLSHIGVLKVLEELGVEIDVISGTSMGAVIGSFYCSGTGVDQMKDYVESLDWKSFLLFSDFSFIKSGGMINGRRVEEVLDRFLGNKSFEDCKIKFNCTAVDIISREEVILDSGPLKDAVRASISIPGLFSPVCFKDKILIDGGIIEPLPTKSIKELKPDIIIGSSIVFENQDRIKALCESEDRPNEESRRGLKRFKAGSKRKVSNIPANTIIDISLNIMHREMTLPYLDYADILIEPEVGDLGFMDFTKGREMIARGVEAAQKMVPAIKKRLKLK